MGDEDVEVFGADLGGVERALCHLAHFESGPTEYRGALQSHVGPLHPVAVEEGHPVDVLADRVVLAAVAAPDDRSELLVLGGADDDGAGAIAEDEAVGAVGHVEGHRQLLGTDDEDMRCASAAHHVGGECHAVTESGAADGDVECGNTVRAEFGGDLRRACRRHEQMGVGREDDGVDVGAGEQSIGDRRAPGLDAHLHDVLVAAREASGLDAGPRVDPLVGGIDVLADLVVGDDALGTVRTDAEHADVVDARCIRDLCHEVPSVMRPDIDRLTSRGYSEVLIRGEGASRPG